MSDILFPYELMKQCILSGQIPHEEAVRIFRDNPAFAEWYAERQKLQKLKE